MRQSTLLVVIPLAVAMVGMIGGCIDDDPASPGSAPTAAFTGSPNSGEAPLTVDFTDQSGGSPTTWSWTFGDGGTSTEQHPSRIFQTAGSFTVSLSASNAVGTDDETKTDYITVTAGTGRTPVLDGILPLGAGSGMTVTLHGQDFGDGNTQASVVMFGTVAASSYPSWLDDEIEVVVPTVDPPGMTQMEVKVVVGGRESNAVTFYRQDENVIRLTRNNADNWQPSWAGNSTIYYASAVGGNFNIWLMDADGDNPVQRTFFTEGHTDMPVYDFPSLYYRSNHEGNWDIYESTGAGTEANLTNTPEKDFEVVLAPSLAPYMIAMSRAEEHNGGTIWNIYGYSLNGFGQISNNNADFHPTFSPNGQQVAYMYKFGDFYPGQIMVVSVDGGESTLISDPEVSCAYPTWNPGYDTIAYTRSADNGRRNIFMCNPDGLDEVQLTFSDFDILYPCWSPDGRRLACAMFVEGHYEVCVVDVHDILVGSRGQ